MGYSVAWDFGVAGISTDRWLSFTRDVKRLMERDALSLAGAEGSGRPMVNESLVAFNRTGGDPTEEFRLRRGMPGTAVLPSDNRGLLALSILLALREQHPDLRITSNLPEQVWQKGLALAQMRLERPLVNAVIPERVSSGLGGPVQLLDSLRQGDQVAALQQLRQGEDALARLQGRHDARMAKAAEAGGGISYAAAVSGPGRQALSRQAGMLDRMRAAFSAMVPGAGEKRFSFSGGRSEIARSWANSILSHAVVGKAPEEVLSLGSAQLARLADMASRVPGAGAAGGALTALAAEMGALAEDLGNRSREHSVPDSQLMNYVGGLVRSYAQKAAQALGESGASSATAQLEALVRDEAAALTADLEAMLQPGRMLDGRMGELVAELEKSAVRVGELVSSGDVEGAVSEIRRLWSQAPEYPLHDGGARMIESLHEAIVETSTGQGEAAARAVLTEGFATLADYGNPDFQSAAHAAEAILRGAPEIGIAEAARLAEATTASPAEMAERIASAAVAHDGDIVGTARAVASGVEESRNSLAYAIDASLPADGGGWPVMDVLKEAAWQLRTGDAETALSLLSETFRGTGVDVERVAMEMAHQLAQSGDAGFAAARIYEFVGEARFEAAAQAIDPALMADVAAWWSNLEQLGAVALSKADATMASLGPQVSDVFQHAVKFSMAAEGMADKAKVADPERREARRAGLEAAFGQAPGAFAGAGEEATALSLRPFGELAAATGAAEIAASLPSGRTEAFSITIETVETAEGELGLQFQAGRPLSPVAASLTRSGTALDLGEYPTRGRAKAAGLQMVAAIRGETWRYAVRPEKGRNGADHVVYAEIPGPAGIQIERIGSAGSSSDARDLVAWHEEKIASQIRRHLQSWEPHRPQIDILSPAADFTNNLRFRIDEHPAVAQARSKGSAIDPVMALRALIHRINPAVEIDLAQLLTADGAQYDAAKARSGGSAEAPSEAIAGYYDTAKHLVAASLSWRHDALENSAHESWHSLEHLFTPAEREFLKAVFPGTEHLTQEERIGLPYPLDRGISSLEHAAYTFGAWTAKRLRTGDAEMANREIDRRVRPIFARANADLDRFAAMLRARGIADSKDIEAIAALPSVAVDQLFTRALNGEIGSRSHVAMASVAADRISEMASGGSNPAEVMAAALRKQGLDVSAGDLLDTGILEFAGVNVGLGFSEKARQEMARVTEGRPVQPDDIIAAALRESGLAPASAVKSRQLNMEHGFISLERSFAVGSGETELAERATLTLLRLGRGAQMTVEDVAVLRRASEAAASKVGIVQLADTVSRMSRRLGLAAAGAAVGATAGATHEFSHILGGALQLLPDDIRARFIDSLAEHGSLGAAAYSRAAELSAMFQQLAASTSLFSIDERVPLHVVRAAYVDEADRVSLGVDRAVADTEAAGAAVFNLPRESESGKLWWAEAQALRVSQEERDQALQQPDSWQEALQAESIESVSQQLASEVPFASATDFSASADPGIEQKRRQKIVQECIDVVRRINPTVTLQFAERLVGLDEAALAASGAGEVGAEVDGFFNATYNLATIAMGPNAANPRRAAIHESMHSLEPFMTPQERHLLRERYPDTTARFDLPPHERRTHHENVAYAFAEWAEAKLKQERGEQLSQSEKRLLKDGSVPAPLIKIRDMLFRVGSALAGTGFQTQRDIFERALNGYVGVRTRRFGQNYPLLATTMHGLNRGLGQLVAKPKAWIGALQSRLPFGLSLGAGTAAVGAIAASRDARDAASTLLPADIQNGLTKLTADLAKSDPGRVLGDWYEKGQAALNAAAEAGQDLFAQIAASEAGQRLAEIGAQLGGVQFSMGQWTPATLNEPTLSEAERQLTNGGLGHIVPVYYREIAATQRGRVALISFHPRAAVDPSQPDYSRTYPVFVEIMSDGRIDVRRESFSSAGKWLTSKEEIFGEGGLGIADLPAAMRAASLRLQTAPAVPSDMFSPDSMRVLRARGDRQFSLRLDDPVIEVTGPARQAVMRVTGLNADLTPALEPVAADGRRKAGKLRYTLSEPGLYMVPEQGAFYEKRADWPGIERHSVSQAYRELLQDQGRRQQLPGGVTNDAVAEVLGLRGSLPPVNDHDRSLSLALKWVAEDFYAGRDAGRSVTALEALVRQDGFTLGKARAAAEGAAAMYRGAMDGDTARTALRAIASMASCVSVAVSGGQELDLSSDRRFSINWLEGDMPAHMPARFNDVAKDVAEKGQVLVRRVVAYTPQRRGWEHGRLPVLAREGDIAVTRPIASWEGASFSLRPRAPRRWDDHRVYEGEILPQLPGFAYVHAPTGQQFHDVPHSEFERIVQERTERKADWLLEMALERAPNLINWTPAENLEQATARAADLDRIIKSGGELIRGGFSFSISKENNPEPRTQGERIREANAIRDRLFRLTTPRFQDLASAAEKQGLVILRRRRRDQVGVMWDYAALPVIGRAGSIAIARPLKERGNWPEGQKPEQAKRGFTFIHSATGLEFERNPNFLKPRSLKEATEFAGYLDDSLRDIDLDVHPVGGFAAQEAGFDLRFSFGRPPEQVPGEMIVQIARDLSFADAKAAPLLADQKMQGFMESIVQARRQGVGDVAHEGIAPGLQAAKQVVPLLLERAGYEKAHVDYARSPIFRYNGNYGGMGSMFFDEPWMDAAAYADRIATIVEEHGKGEIGNRASLGELARALSSVPMPHDERSLNWFKTGLWSLGEARRKFTELGLVHPTADDKTPPAELANDPVFGIPSSETVMDPRTGPGEVFDVCSRHVREVSLNAYRQHELDSRMNDMLRRSEAEGAISGLGADDIVAGALRARDSIRAWADEVVRRHDKAGQPATENRRQADPVAEAEARVNLREAVRDFARGGEGLASFDEPGVEPEPMLRGFGGRKFSFGQFSLEAVAPDEILSAAVNNPAISAAQLGRMMLEDGYSLEAVRYVMAPIVVAPTNSGCNPREVPQWLQDAVISARVRKVQEERDHGRGLLRGTPEEVAAAYYGAYFSGDRDSLDGDLYRWCHAQAEGRVGRDHGELPGHAVERAWQRFTEQGFARIDDAAVLQPGALNGLHEQYAVTANRLREAAVDWAAMAEAAMTQDRMPAPLRSPSPRANLREIVAVEMLGDMPEHALNPLNAMSDRLRFSISGLRRLGVEAGARPLKALQGREDSDEAQAAALARQARAGAAMLAARLETLAWLASMAPTPSERDQQDLERLHDLAAAVPVWTDAMLSRRSGASAEDFRLGDVAFSKTELAPPGLADPADFAAACERAARRASDVARGLKGGAGGYAEGRDALATALHMQRTIHAIASGLALMPSPLPLKAPRLPKKALPARSPGERLAALAPALAERRFSMGAEEAQPGADPADGDMLAGPEEIHAGYLAALRSAADHHAPTFVSEGYALTEIPVRVESGRIAMSPGFVPQGASSGLSIIPIYRLPKESPEPVLTFHVALGSTGYSTGAVQFSKPEFAIAAHKLLEASLARSGSIPLDNAEFLAEGGRFFKAIEENIDALNRLIRQEREVIGQQTVDHITNTTRARGMAYMEAAVAGKMVEMELHGWKPAELKVDFDPMPVTFPTAHGFVSPDPNARLAVACRPDPFSQIGLEEPMWLLLNRASGKTIGEPYSFSNPEIAAMAATAVEGLAPWDMIVPGYRRDPALAALMAIKTPQFMETIARHVEEDKRATNQRKRETAHRPVEELRHAVASLQELRGAHPDEASKALIDTLVSTADVAIVFYDTLDRMAQNPEPRMAKRHSGRALARIGDRPIAVPGDILRAHDSVVELLNSAELGPAQYDRLSNAVMKLPALLNNIDKMGFTLGRLSEGKFASAADVEYAAREALRWSGTDMELARTPEDIEWRDLGDKFIQAQLRGYFEADEVGPLQKGAMEAIERGEFGEAIRMMAEVNRIADERAQDVSASAADTRQAARGTAEANSYTNTAGETDAGSTERSWPINHGSRQFSIGRNPVETIMAEFGLAPVQGDRVFAPAGPGEPTIGVRVVAEDQPFAQLPGLGPDRYQVIALGIDRTVIDWNYTSPARAAMTAQLLDEKLRAAGPLSAEDADISKSGSRLQRAAVSTVEKIADLRKTDEKAFNYRLYSAVRQAGSTAAMQRARLEGNLRFSISAADSGAAERIAEINRERVLAIAGEMASKGLQATEIELPAGSALGSLPGFVPASPNGLAVVSFMSEVPGWAVMHTPTGKIFGHVFHDPARAAAAMWRIADVVDWMDAAEGMRANRHYANRLAEEAGAAMRGEAMADSEDYNNRLIATFDREAVEAQGFDTSQTFWVRVKEGGNPHIDPRQNVYLLYGSRDAAEEQDIYNVAPVYVRRENQADLIDGGAAVREYLAGLYDLNREFILDKVGEYAEAAWQDAFSNAMPLPAASPDDAAEQARAAYDLEAFIADVAQGNWNRPGGRNSGGDLRTMVLLTLRDMTGAKRIRYRDVYGVERLGVFGASSLMLAPDRLATARDIAAAEAADRLAREKAFQAAHDADWIAKQRERIERQGLHFDPLKLAQSGFQVDRPFWFPALSAEVPIVEAAQIGDLRVYPEYHDVADRFADRFAVPVYVRPGRLLDLTARPLADETVQFLLDWHRDLGARMRIHNLGDDPSAFIATVAGGNWEAFGAEADEMRRALAGRAMLAGYRSSLTPHDGTSILAIHDPSDAQLAYDRWKQAEPERTLNDIGAAAVASYRATPMFLEGTESLDLLGRHAGGGLPALHTGESQAHAMANAIPARALAAQRSEIVRDVAARRLIEAGALVVGDVPAVMFLDGDRYRAIDADALALEQAAPGLAAGRFVQIETMAEFDVEPAKIESLLAQAAANGRAVVLVTPQGADLVLDIVGSRDGQPVRLPTLRLDPDSQGADLRQAQEGVRLAVDAAMAQRGGLELEQAALNAKVAARSDEVIAIASGPGRDGTGQWTLFGPDAELAVAAMPELGAAMQGLDGNVRLDLDEATARTLGPALKASGRRLALGQDHRRSAWRFMDGAASQSEAIMSDQMKAQFTAGSPGLAAQAQPAQTQAAQTQAAPPQAATMQAGQAQQALRSPHEMRVQEYIQQRLQQLPETHRTPATVSEAIQSHLAMIRVAMGQNQAIPDRVLADYRPDDLGLATVDPAMAARFGFDLSKPYYRGAAEAKGAWPDEREMPLRLRMDPDVAGTDGAEVQAFALKPVKTFDLRPGGMALPSSTQTVIEILAHKATMLPERVRGNLAGIVEVVRQGRLREGFAELLAASGASQTEVRGDVHKLEQALMVGLQERGYEGLQSQDEQGRPVTLVWNPRAVLPFRAVAQMQESQQGQAAAAQTFGLQARQEGQEQQQSMPFGQPQQPQAAVPGQQASQPGQQTGQTNVIQPPAGTFGGTNAANDSSFAAGLHRPSAPIASAFAAPDRSPMQPVQGAQVPGARQATAPTAPIGSQSNPAGMAAQGVQYSAHPAYTPIQFGRGGPVAMDNEQDDINPVQAEVRRGIEDALKLLDGMPRRGGRPHQEDVRRLLEQMSFESGEGERQPLLNRALLGRLEPLSEGVFPLTPGYVLYFDATQNKFRAQTVDAFMREIGPRGANASLFGAKQPKLVDVLADWSGIGFDAADPETQQAVISFQNEVKSIVAAVAPHAEGIVVGKLFGDGNAVLEAGAVLRDRQPVSGLAFRNYNLFLVSADPTRGDVLETTFHELYHFNSPLLREEERLALELNADKIHMAMDLYDREKLERELKDRQRELDKIQSENPDSVMIRSLQDRIRTVETQLTSKEHAPPRGATPEERAAEAFARLAAAMRRDKTFRIEKYGPDILPPKTSVFGRVMAKVKDLKDFTKEAYDDGGKGMLGVMNAAWKLTWATLTMGNKAKEQSGEKDAQAVVAAMLDGTIAKRAQKFDLSKSVAAIEAQRIIKEAGLTNMAAVFEREARANRQVDNKRLYDIMAKALSPEEIRDVLTRAGYHVIEDKLSRTDILSDWAQKKAELVRWSTSPTPDRIGEAAPRNQAMGAGPRESQRPADQPWYKSQHDFVAAEMNAPQGVQKAKIIERVEQQPNPLVAGQMREVKVKYYHFPGNEEIGLRPMEEKVAAYENRGGPEAFLRDVHHTFVKAAYESGRHVTADAIAPYRDQAWAKGYIPDVLDEAIGNAGRRSPRRTGPIAARIGVAPKASVRFSFGSQAPVQFTRDGHLAAGQHGVYRIGRDPGDKDTFHPQFARSVADLAAGRVQPLSDFAVSAAVARMIVSNHASGYGTLVPYERNDGDRVTESGHLILNGQAGDWKIAQETDKGGYGAGRTKLHLLEREGRSVVDFGEFQSESIALCTARAVDLALAAAQSGRDHAFPDSLFQQQQLNDNRILVAVRVGDVTSALGAFETEAQAEAAKTRFLDTVRTGVQKAGALIPEATRRFSISEEGQKKVFGIDLRDFVQTSAAIGTVGVAGAGAYLLDVMNRPSPSLEEQLPPLDPSLLDAEAQSERIMNDYHAAILRDIFENGNFDAIAGSGDAPARFAGVEQSLFENSVALHDLLGKVAEKGSLAAAAADRFMLEKTGIDAAGVAATVERAMLKAATSGREAAGPALGEAARLVGQIPEAAEQAGQFVIAEGNALLEKGADMVGIEYDSGNELQEAFAKLGEATQQIADYVNPDLPVQPIPVNDHMLAEGNRLAMLLNDIATREPEQLLRNVRDFGVMVGDKVNEYAIQAGQAFEQATGIPLDQVSDKVTSLFSGIQFSMAAPAAGEIEAIRGGMRAAAAASAASAARSRTATRQQSAEVVSLDAQRQRNAEAKADLGRGSRVYFDVAPEQAERALGLGARVDHRTGELYVAGGDSALRRVGAVFAAKAPAAEIWPSADRRLAAVEEGSRKYAEKVMPAEMAGQKAARTASRTGESRTVDMADIGGAAAEGVFAQSPGLAGGILPKEKENADQRARADRGGPDSAHNMLEAGIKLIFDPAKQAVGTIKEVAQTAMDARRRHVEQTGEDRAENPVAPQQPGQGPKKVRNIGPIAGSAMAAETRLAESAPSKSLATVAEPFRIADPRDAGARMEAVKEISGLADRDLLDRISSTQAALGAIRVERGGMKASAQINRERLQAGLAAAVEVAGKRGLEIPKLQAEAPKPETRSKDKGRER